MKTEDTSKSWTVCEEEDGWYYYNADGEPHGPFADKDQAEERLEWCERHYYDDYEN